MKNQDQKKILIKTESLKKEFAYKKGDTSLSFTLRIDVKQQMKDFRDLLLEGVKDLDLHIEKLDGAK